MARHDVRCAIFDEPPSLRDPKDCNCGSLTDPQELRRRIWNTLARHKVSYSSRAPIYGDQIHAFYEMVVDDLMKEIRR